MKILSNALVLLGFVSTFAFAEVPVERAVPDREKGAEKLEQEFKQLKRVVDNRQRFQQDLQQDIISLQDQVQKLLGKIEEQAYQIERLTDRQRSLYKDVDSRIVDINQKIKTDEQAKTAQSAPGQQGVEGGEAVDPEKSQEALNVVNAAFELLREKKYKEAILAYKAFLNDYPESKYAVNAHYWLGQIYYVLKSYKLSFNAFNQVIEFFPNSPKAADALLKQGNIHMAEGNKADAKLKFKEVIKSYPSSPAARLAQDELNKLGKK